MATYTNLENKIKENIVVDYVSRATGQQVKLFNKYNELCGIFHGDIVAGDLQVASGRLSNVTIIGGEIINSTLKTPAGSNVDFTEIGNKLDAISSNIDKLNTTTIPNIMSGYQSADIELSTFIIESTSGLTELSGDVGNIISSINLLKNDIDEKLSNINIDILEEITDRESLSTEIDKKIDEITLSISQKIDDKIFEESQIRYVADEKLETALNTEILDRISTDNYISVELENRSLGHRHYSIENKLDKNTTPIKLTEFATNILTAGMFVKSGIVYNMTDADTAIAIIKSYDIENHSVTIKTVSNLSEKYRSMITPSQEYTITTNGTKLASGYTIKLNWDNDNINTCEIEIYPTYSEYYALYWIDNEQNPIQVGRLVEAYAIDGTIISGYLTIDSSCSEFQQFNIQAREISEDNPITNIQGFPNNKIKYIGNNNFVFEAGLEYYKVVYTNSLPQEGFAKIYKKDFIKDDSGINQIGIYVDNYDNLNILNRDNNFTVNITDNINISAEFFENNKCIIDLYEENKLYNYLIVESDNTENNIGRIIMSEYNVKLSDNFTSNISVEFNIEDLNGYTFVLEYTNVNDIWKCITSINDNPIIITYYKNSNKISYNLNKQPDTTLQTGEYTVDTTDNLYSDDSIHKKSSEMILIFSDDDSNEPAKTYNVTSTFISNPVDNIKLNMSTNDANKFKFEIPSKNDDNISREFILVIKPETSDENIKNVELEFVGEKDENLIYFNDKKFKVEVPVNKYTTLKLQEINFGKFIVLDLNQNSQEFRINELFDDVATLNTNLNNEISRSTATDIALEQAIADETARAETAEAKLSSDLDAEIARSAGVEKELIKAINDEIDRATKAESDLKTEITNESERSKDIDERLKQAIVDEQSRAETAESELDKKITAETERATEAEKANSDAIAAEKSRAEGIEAELDSKITTETTRATEAEAELRSDLDAEIARAETAEKANSDAIAAEKERAEGVEAEIKADIQNIQNKIAGGICYKGQVYLTSSEMTVDNVTYVINNIKDIFALKDNPSDNTYEQLKTKYGWQRPDNTYTTETLLNNGWMYYVNITNDEKNLRFTLFDDDNNTIEIDKGDYIVINISNSDTIKISDLKISNLNIIDAEDSDVVRLKDLDAEIARAKTAEQANADAIAAETERATEAESELDSKIATETARAETAESELDKKITDEIARAKDAEQANADAIATETARATEAETKLRSDLDAEEERAKAVESGLDKKITDEIDRAKDAEQANADAIVAETTRAEGIEAELRSDLDAEIARAKTAEQANADAIVAETTRATEAESDLTQKISKYDNTFTDKDINNDTDGHIKSNNLILTDINSIDTINHNHDRYYMTFKYGTMVLVKLEDNK